MSWASESGRAMFPFPEIGRTLVMNTVAGARAMVARAESYERVPDMGHSRKYSTVSPPCRNKSVRNRPTLPFASSAYAIRASRPGCPRKACSRPPTSRTSVRDRTAMSLAASWNRLLPTTCGMESSGTVRRSNSPSRRLISSTRRTDWASPGGDAGAERNELERVETAVPGCDHREADVRIGLCIPMAGEVLERGEHTVLVQAPHVRRDQAGHRARVLAEGAGIDNRVRGVVVDVGIRGEIDVDADGPALHGCGRADRVGITGLAGGADRHDVREGGRADDAHAGAPLEVGRYEERQPGPLLQRVELGGDVERGAD